MAASLRSLVAQLAARVEVHDGPGEAHGDVVIRIAEDLDAYVLRRAHHVRGLRQERSRVPDELVPGERIPVRNISGGRREGCPGRLRDRGGVVAELVAEEEIDVAARLQLEHAFAEALLLSRRAEMREGE